MAQLIEVILPVFLLIAAGYAAAKTGAFPVKYVDGLMKFTQSFAFPCLLFRAVASFDIGEEFHISLMGSYYVSVTIAFFLGMFGARLLGREWQDCVVIGFSCLFVNSLMLGIPITERAYGAEALAGNFAIVSIHAPFCYCLGIVVMEIVRSPKGELRLGALARQIGRQVARNPLVIGLMLGFVVNLSGLTLPVPVRDTIDMMVGAAVPAGLFAVGGVLVQYKLEGDWRVIGMICVITLLIHPALVMGLGTLGGLDRDAMRSAVLTAAVAPGINTYVFADIYGRARRVAASALLISTVVSVLTVWMWLSILP